MKSIKCLSEDIECVLDMAEDFAKKAIMYKLEQPNMAKTYYNQSVACMAMVKDFHNNVVTLIDAYKSEHGEPPAPMMAIYNYLHERHINKAAAIKNLQELYT